MITFQSDTQVVNIESNLVYPSNNQPVLPNVIQRTASGVPIVEKWLSYEKDIITLVWKKMSITEHDLLLTFFRTHCNWSGKTITYTDLDSNQWQCIITGWSFSRNSPGYYEGQIVLETVS